MMLRELLKTNKRLHLFSNSVLGGNTVLSGRENTIRGITAGLMLRTGVQLWGRDNRLALGEGCFLRNTKIYVQGRGNRVTIGAGAALHNCLIWVVGDQNEISIGRDTVMQRVEFGAEGQDSTIVCAGQSCVGGFVQLGLSTNYIAQSQLYAGEGCRITIGGDTLVSDGAKMRTSDSHPIFDQTGQRMNLPAGIRVGRHAWVGSHASLLKGAGVGDGSVVGHRSVVTKDFSSTPNALLVGMPAKVLRTGIRWQSEQDAQAPLP